MAFIHGGTELYQSTEVPLNNVVLYNIRDNSISEKVVHNGPARSHHTAVALDDTKVCIVGGWDGKKRLADVFLYNLVDRMWTSLKRANGSDNPVGLSGHTCTLVGENEMIVTGREGGVRMQRRYGSVFKLKINDKSNSYFYNEMSQHIASRSGHTCSVMHHGQKQTSLVLYGGRDSENPDILSGIKITNNNSSVPGVDDILNSKSATINWKPCRAPKLRFHATLCGHKYAIIHGGEVFGRARDTVSSDIRVHDTLCKNWWQLNTENLSENHRNNLCRMGHEIVFIDNKLYIIGGIGKNGKHSVGSVVSINIS